MTTKVLLVDDDPNILKLLDYTFRQQGYDTLTAANGATALTLLEQVSLDLIVTDVMMPVMNGYDLCRKVRNDRRWQTLPFIFLSARGSTEDRITGLELGADDYVVKPFDRRELLAKARTLINRVRIYRNQISETVSERGRQEALLSQSSLELSADAPVHVLLVEDDDPMRWLMDLNLRKARFEVSTAGNGQEALDAVRNQSPDLIISDVMMPVMDGIQLRRALLEKDEYRSIPFLFLTAKGQPDDMMAGLLLGADDYLTKPVSPQVLIQKARNLVTRHRADAHRYRRAVEQAANRMSSYLEPAVPSVEGITFSQRSEPLEVRGGDYYDYIELDSGLVALVVGDVMGKKWGAWFFSIAYIAYLRSVIRSTSATATSPAAIIRRINHLLWEDLKISEVFTTLLFGIVNPTARTVTFANAGHLPPVHFDAKTGTAASSRPGGLILGVQPDQVYEEETVILKPGDALVIYSDGITEARNESDELFGEERLREAVESSGRTGGALLVDGIFEAAERFADGTPYDDDRTVVVIQTHG